MTPRRLMLLAGSLAVAVLAWWLTPAVLAFVGLGDARMVGQVCLTVLALSGLETDPAAALAQARGALTSGAAAEVFGRMVHALGGPADIVERAAVYLSPAPVIRPVLADEAGYLAACDTRGIGLAVIELGGGRSRPDDAIDHRVGFDRLLPLGSKVEKGDEIGRVHAAHADDAARATERLAALYAIAPEAPALSPDILARISA